MTEEFNELPVPDDVSQLFQSRYLHAADLGGKTVTLTIERIKFEEVNDFKKNNSTKLMGSIVFAGKKKALGLNRTNAERIKAMFGPKLKQWIGKRVTIYPTTTRMPLPGLKGKLGDVECIRVKGSPDIEGPISFELRLPNKGAQLVKLEKTILEDKSIQNEAKTDENN
jgi:hypothetical protein